MAMTVFSRARALGSNWPLAPGVIAVEGNGGEKKTETRPVCVCMYTVLSGEYVNWMGIYFLDCKRGGGERFCVRPQLCAVSVLRVMCNLSRMLKDVCRENDPCSGPWRAPPFCVVYQTLHCTSLDTFSPPFSLTVYLWFNCVLGATMCIFRRRLLLFRF